MRDEKRESTGFGRDNGHGIGLDGGSVCGDQSIGGRRSACGNDRG